MEILEWDIFRDLVKTGLANNVVVWSPIWPIPAWSSAAHDFIAQFSTVAPGSVVIDKIGGVRSVVLDKIKPVGGRKLLPLLHIIWTHEGDDWGQVGAWVQTWFDTIKDIIDQREQQDDAAQVNLATIMAGIDRDSMSREDIELLNLFSDAALGPIVASVLIWAWSAAKWEKVPLRVILAAMTSSKLWDRTKVVLRTQPEPSLVNAGINPTPKPLITARARQRVVEVFDLAEAA